MKLAMQKTENENTAVMAAKETLKNIPIVLASSIPVVGEVVALVKDTYDGIQMEKRFEGIEKDLDSLISFGPEIESVQSELENYQSELQKFQSEFKKIQDEFERAMKDTVTANEEYSIKNVKGIEIFFADHVEINDYDFIVELENALEEINEDDEFQSEYECEYGEYVLDEQSLKILFDNVCDRECVDEYIKKITICIYDKWKDVSRIGRVRYY